MFKVFVSCLSVLVLLILGRLDISLSTISEKEKVYNNFVTDLNQLEESLTLFGEGDFTHVDLSEKYVQLRSNFKAVEPLLYYLFPDEYNRYLNGAPLPKLEPNVPEINVIPPKGLQRMDELVHEAHPDLKAIQKIADDMLTSIRYIQKMVPTITLQDRHVLEASRLQLVRIASLCLSGFDTPGGSNYLDDLHANLLTLQFIFKSYHQEELLVSLHKLSQEVSVNQEKEIIDAANLIRNHINPIYEDILDFHLQSGIEHVDEVADQELQVNYYAKNIFDTDFLNKSAFTRISETDLYETQSKLGKLLFYDPILSKDLTSSCASCHHPSLAFTDGKKVMIGDQKASQSNRNTPTLINSIYNRKYFHDMRASKPDLQIDHVIYNEKEFNIDYVELIKRLQENDHYAALFKKAFPDINNSISRYTITNSITQYVSSLSSFNSDFDRYMRQEIATIDQDVVEGFNLFMGKAACGSCHFIPVFNGLVPPGFNESESEILGVLANNDFDHPVLDQDSGRMKNGNLREQSEIYMRSFKTPTLRNVSLTAPYMHNGVHHTLEETMTFYNNGGGQGMGLEVPYQTLPPDTLGLTTMEQNQIIRFMESLVDTTGMTSPPKMPLHSKQ